MRQIIESQMRFGDVDISKINVDYKSRDEIDKCVIGLQYIYTNAEIRNKVFDVLEGITPSGTSKHRGRPGMDLWKILVLGVIRQATNFDYDKLHNIANNHMMIRELLGHNRYEDYDKMYRYELQTLKDNITLLTPELINKINVIVVEAGHKLLTVKKKKNYSLA